MTPATVPETDRMFEFAISLRVAAMDQKYEIAVVFDLTHEKVVTVDRLCGSAMVLAMVPARVPVTD